MHPLAARAQQFATKAHEGQMYGDLPFIIHPTAVYVVLLDFGYEDDPGLQAAGFLHDVLEDTKTTESDLVLAGFEDPVIVPVVNVTNQPGRNRRARAKATYPYIIRDERSVALKLADRIANTRHSMLNDSDGKFIMYRNEFPHFHKAILSRYYHDHRIDAMRRYLIELYQ